MGYDLGQVIATRKLTIEGDPTISVEVLMGVPQRMGAGDDFVCPVQILGFGDEKVSGVHGVDEFQALQLAMEFLGIELYVKLNRKCNGKLRWHGESDLRFPLPESVAEFGTGYFENL